MPAPDVTITFDTAQDAELVAGFLAHDPGAFHDYLSDNTDWDEAEIEFMVRSIIDEVSNQVSQQAED